MPAASGTARAAPPPVGRLGGGCLQRAVSQTRIVRSELPERGVLPSGEKASDVTGPWCPEQYFKGSANSGLGETRDRKTPWFPFRRRTSSPAARSQRTTSVRSANANRRPP